MIKKLLPAYALMSVYFIFCNFFRLSVRREKTGHGIKIAHISDLHKRNFGKDNCRIIEKVRRESPDLIFVTGDIVSRNQKDATNAVKLLKDLCDIAPVYMISGNHEQSLNFMTAGKFSADVRNTDVIWLRNDSRDINLNGRNLRIYGLMENYGTYKKNGSYKDLDKLTVNYIRELIGEPSDGLNILLAHNPLFGEVYSEWGADYTFSGHVHGGVVRLFGKGFFSPERKWFPKYSKGIYKIGKMKLCVSAGLGKFRLFNPPEIVIYEI